MKIIFYFLLTCFISTGACYGALYSRTPFLLYAVAAGIWVLFIRWYFRRSKKDAERRQMQQQFQDFMRTQSRSRR
ncbi:MAG: hypothetical protein JST19_20470 [Bacteroidetes bacterium]|nr:hypothetical protein [Bacteroidota bacterium]